MKQWAFYDEEGDVVRIVDYPAKGALPYPPPPPRLAPDDPEWFNIPF